MSHYVCIDGKTTLSHARWNMHRAGVEEHALSFTDMQLAQVLQQKNHPEEKTQIGNSGYSKDLVTSSS